MTHAFETITVAIGDLVEHPDNVRAKSPDARDPEIIAHLQASIAALGLLQGLIVQKIGKKFGVLAGSRRHAALTALAADKKAKGFTSKTKVECRLVPEDCEIRTALSLAENITHLAMHPIDEFEAFARMMEVDGQTPETIANIFGTTVAAVKGRLRFGLVHPDIRAEARAKHITLDVMKSFADHPSQEVQLAVFEELKAADTYLSSHSVRQALKSRGIKASDPMAALVRAEYDARGGTLARDLLEEHSVLEDAALVESILLERLQTAAKEAQEKYGFAWSDAVVSYDHGAMSEYGRVYPGPIDLDEASQKRVEEIEAELEQCAEQMQDEDLSDAAYDQLTDKIDVLEDEVRGLQEAYSAEDLGRAGVMASWLRGEIQLHAGLVRPEDKAKPAGAPSSGTSATDAAPSNDIVYAASLQDDLKTERAMALGAAMAYHPEATMDLTLFKLVHDVLSTGMSATHAFKINAGKQYRTHAKMDEIDGTSLEQTADAYDALDVSWLDDSRAPADQFAAFRALEAGEKAKLVAYATASTTEPCLARSAARDSLMHNFEIEVMPDIRAHWTPNAALFKRFKKAVLLNILASELGLAQEAASLGTSSKNDIVAFMDKLFAEPFATLTEAQRDAVARWCPPDMQTTHHAADEGEDDETDVIPEAA